MIIALSKAKFGFGALALGALLGGSPHRRMPHRGPVHPGSSRRILMIRVSQESSPDAGDFDKNILGFIRALQSTGNAADFYEYGKISANYGNTLPALTSNTSHIFFVNAKDGLALFVVHNNSNHAEDGDGGSAKTVWELSGGTSSILLADESQEAWSREGGTVFTADMHWAQSNTDGLVVGALPVGFMILGQFLVPPTGLGGGWVAISDDGTRIPLRVVPGQRVRLDVALHVKVQQDN